VAQSRSGVAVAEAELMALNRQVDPPRQRPNPPADTGRLDHVVKSRSVVASAEAELMTLNRHMDRIRASKTRPDPDKRGMDPGGKASALAEAERARDSAVERLLLVSRDRCSTVTPPPDPGAPHGVSFWLEIF